MDRAEYEKCQKAINGAISRVLEKGSDDVFRPPIFSKSIESRVLDVHSEQFRADAYKKTLDFIKVSNLEREGIGPTRRGLIIKDENTFRQVAWLDPFDAVKFLTIAILVFEDIERVRLPKEMNCVHSHRLSSNVDELFDSAYGYDSFRTRSAELSQQRIGKWKIVTDIANFFDRVGNHTLENHLLNAGSDHKHVKLIREMLFFWAGDRRSFGIPVGSDASRILAEAVLLSVDQGLHERNITFVRYVDDYRLFADSKAEALKFIEILTTLLAEEGLSLNSRKTSISKIELGKDAEAGFADFEASEHEVIDLEAREVVRKRVRVSGQSTISRFYRKPGQETLRKLKLMSVQDVISTIRVCEESVFETNLKLAIKFFVYVDQDVEI